MITPRQIRALAHWVAALRPAQTSWTAVAIEDALTIAVDAGWATEAEPLSRAAVRAAHLPAVEYPAQIADPGPHWDEVRGWHRPESIPTLERIRAIREAATPPVLFDEPDPPVETANLQGDLL